MPLCRNSLYIYTIKRCKLVLTWFGKSHILKLIADAEVPSKYSQLQMLTSSIALFCFVLYLRISVVLPVALPPTIIKFTNWYDTELESIICYAMYNTNLLLQYLVILDLRYDSSFVGLSWYSCGIFINWGRFFKDICLRVPWRYDNSKSKNFSSSLSFKYKVLR